MAVSVARRRSVRERIATLIITGTLTTCCCESNANVMQRNFRVIFVANGQATQHDTGRHAAIANITVPLADLTSPRRRGGTGKAIVRDNTVKTGRMA